MIRMRTADKKQQASSERHLYASLGHSGERGFTLLLAALVSSIVLALGASIFTLAQKEITLSSLGRDSQFAFYAADTAVECALYWDFRYSYFGTSSPPGIDPTCDGQTLNATGRSDTYPYTMTSAAMELFQDVQPIGHFCTQVSVTKSLDASSAVRTVIHADGYSVGCDSIETSSRTLQRSVELRY